MSDDCDESEAREAALTLTETAIQFILLHYNCIADDAEMLDDVCDLIEQVLQYLSPWVLNDNSYNELFTAVRDLAVAIKADRESRYVLPMRKGRPEVDIEEDQLHYLIDQGFTIYDISVMFDCSRRTVERKMRKKGLSIRNYTPLTDPELDSMVSEITTLFPYCGEKSVSSRLRSCGILLKRDRIRASLRRVNPSGIVLRSRAVLQRRSYQVPSPNALWHLDGYHKLIRWRFVIHGAVDGFSRLITFLKVAGNNRAETVLSAFQQGVDEFGLPSRVRMDKGGENVAVAQFMIEHPQRGPGRGSAITGRSIHNQRIERLWRDLFSGCVSFFYSLFYAFEDNGLLNINCPLDLYALHIVFIPTLQQHLDLFREGWAHHHMRTEGNRSPQQLWILGLQNATDDDMAINGLNIRKTNTGEHSKLLNRILVQFLLNDATMVNLGNEKAIQVEWDGFGIDWDGPTPLDDEATVAVNELQEVLTYERRQQLERLLSPLSTSTFSQQEMLGKYAVAKSFVHQYSTA